MASAIDSIEAKVLQEIPGATLNQYARFYSVEQTPDGPKVSAEWVGPDFPLDDRPPGRYLVPRNEFPGVVTHSGCRGTIRIEAPPKSPVEIECDALREIEPPPPPL
jgi:hypothetical protein